MIARIGSALAVNNGCIAGLVSAEAEVVEFLNHLASVNVLVQAAVGVGTLVFGVLLGQCGKALFGFLSGLIFRQNLFRKCLGCFLGFVAVVSFLVGLRHDQDMPDACSGIVVVLPSQVHHNRISGGIFLRIGKDLDIAFLTVGLQPFGIGLVKAAAADARTLRRLGFRLGLYRNGKALLDLFDIVAVLVCHRNGIGCSFCLGAALLVCGHFDGIFRSLFTGHRCLNGFGSDIVEIEIKQVVVAVQALIILLQLFVGPGEALELFIVNLLRQGHIHCGLTGNLRRNAAAVIHGKQLVGIGIAVGLGCLVHPFELRINLGDLFLGQGNAVLLCIVQHGPVLLHIHFSEIPEIVSPGSAVGHAAFLIIEPCQAETGIQAKVGEVTAIVVLHGQELIAVVVVHLCGRILGTVRRHCRRSGIHEAGIQKENGGNQHNNADGTPGPFAL